MMLEENKIVDQAQQVMGNLSQKGIWLLHRRYGNF